MTRKSQGGGSVDEGPQKSPFCGDVRTEIQPISSFIIYAKCRQPDRTCFLTADYYSTAGEHDNCLSPVWNLGV